MCAPSFDLCDQLEVFHRPAEAAETQRDGVQLPAMQIEVAVRALAVRGSCFALDACRSPEEARWTFGSDERCATFATRLLLALVADL